MSRLRLLLAGYVLPVLRPLLVLAGAGLLAGCNLVVMNPSGDVALRQRDLIIASTCLMLLIIVPVMIATAVFAWRYRASNTAATYDPHWHHSTGLEVVIWTAPLLIIIALGALTWISTHLLDPFRPVARLDASRSLPAAVKPLRVQVVALDWKWLFFYPDQGIATVNELAAPVDTPIEFRLTSATVMNAFFVPTLSGMIYTMAGMETQLHAVANREGVFEGFSSNYSGAGFSHMNFRFHSLSPQGFEDWVGKAKQGGNTLDDKTYQELEKPSEAEPVRYFASVRPGLYPAILNMCAQPGKMCMAEMMQIDAKGGGGPESEANRERLIYDGHRSREGVEEPGATFPASGRPPNTNVQPQGMKPDALTPTVNQQGAQPAQGQPGKSQQEKGQSGQGNQHLMPGMSDENSPAPAQMNQN